MQINLLHPIDSFFVINIKVIVSSLRSDTDDRRYKLKSLNKQFLEMDFCYALAKPSVPRKIVMIL